jgi:hypothetical protein
LKRATGRFEAFNTPCIIDALMASGIAAAYFALHRYTRSIINDMIKSPLGRPQARGRIRNVKNARVTPGSVSGSRSCSRRRTILLRPTTTGGVSIVSGASQVSIWMTGPVCRWHLSCPLLTRSTYLGNATLPISWHRHSQ